MEVEYLVETYDKSFSQIATEQERIKFAKALNKKGELGWELAQMKELPGSAGVLLVFKYINAS